MVVKSDRYPWNGRQVTDHRATRRREACAGFERKTSSGRWLSARARQTSCIGALRQAEVLHMRTAPAAVGRNPRIRREHMSRPPAAPLSLAPDQMGRTAPRPLSVRDVCCDVPRRIVRPVIAPKLRAGDEAKRCRSQSTRRTVFKPCASPPPGTGRITGENNGALNQSAHPTTGLNSRVKKAYSTRCEIILYGFPAGVASALWRSGRENPRNSRALARNPRI